MSSRRFIITMTGLLLLFTMISCTSIYFNTFHNIRKNFNGAEDSRKKAGRDKAAGAEVGMYNTAITKASKVLEKHPNSSWVDDALFVIGASYYYLGEFSKSSRKFKELFANYPQSSYVPEARLIYAKAKLNMDEEAEAIVVFEEIFEKDAKSKNKTEAARALGSYYFDNGDYDKANKYFRSLIDSLGEQQDRLRAYIYMGNGYYNTFQFQPAFNNYKKAMDQDPDTLQKYHLLYNMAWCDFYLNRLADGFDKLETLKNDETYYDSLPSILLAMARGNEWDGDLDAAISNYEQVILEKPKSEASAVAQYELGLIYQYDYEDLKKAHQYYQAAMDERRNSSIYVDATRRASQLAMLETFTADESLEISPDSAVQLSQAQLDNIARSQYLLGELFYMDLDKPDSALQSFQKLIDRFPRSRYAPRALMSMAYIERDVKADTVAYDSLLRLILSDYGKYDEAQDVLGLLGLVGTAADKGYAAKIYNRAEDFYDQFTRLDSSEYYYREAADSALQFENQRREDSLRQADSLRVLDSLQAARVLAGEIPKDSLKVEDVVLKTEGESTKVDSLAADSATIDSIATDSTLAKKTEKEKEKEVLVFDSIWTVDSVWTVDSTWLEKISEKAAPNLRIDTTIRIDSSWVYDSVRATVREKRFDTTYAADSTIKIDTVTISVPGYKVDSSWTKTTTYIIDTTELPIEKLAGEDSLQITPPTDSLDTTDRMPTAAPDPEGTINLTKPPHQKASPLDRFVLHKIDTLALGDSVLVLDSGLTLDSALSVNSRMVPVSEIAAAKDTTVADTVRTIDVDKYWANALKLAGERYSDTLMSLLDSTLYYYQYVIDSFPMSDYSIQARYAMLYIYDNNLLPGDSSLIDMYLSFVDSFPNSEYADAIAKKYRIVAKHGIGTGPDYASQLKAMKEKEEQPEASDTVAAINPQDTISSGNDQSVSRFTHDENGNTLEPADKYFLREDVPFEYPLEALGLGIEGKFYFHIRIDFNGEVAESKFMNPSANNEFNDRLTKTVESSKFDYGLIDPNLYDKWFYYTREVRIPTEYRGQ